MSEISPLSPSRKFSSRYISLLGIFTLIFTVTLITVYFYSPVIKTNAEEMGYSEKSSTEVVFSIVPNISITAPPKLNLDITPTPEGTFQTGSLDVVVDTNSSNGYTLTMSSSSEEDKLDSHIVSSDPAAITTISSLSSDTAEDAFPINSWGYSKDNTNYHPIPKLSTPTTLKEINTPVSNSNKTTKVTFGIKASNNLQPGNYRNTMVFSAFAHLPPELVFDGITTMQEMTPEICRAETTPTKEATEITNSHTEDTNKVPRTTLKDVRDGKNYLVSKLADGNCWMSQNLELDLDPAKPLSSDTTDLNTKTTWTPENKTQNTTGITWSIGGTEGARSYDPPTNEDYVQIGESNRTLASQSSYPGNPNYEWERTGILYNWSAATAGTIISNTHESIINDSICPKSWKLPDNDGTQSIFNLISTVYGIGGPYGGWGLAKSPFHMPGAGYYEYDSGTPKLQTYSTAIWTNTAKNEKAYFLYTDHDNLTIQYLDRKGYGYSVRCVAR